MGKRIDPCCYSYRMNIVNVVNGCEGADRRIDRNRGMMTWSITLTFRGYGLILRLTGQLLHT